MVNSASGKRLEMFVHERVDVCERFGLLMPRLFCYYCDKLLKTTVMLFRVFFFVMTCTMKFWIKYGLVVFEFDTARIMKFSRSLPAKIVFPPYASIFFLSLK